MLDYNGMALVADRISGIIADLRVPGKLRTLLTTYKYVMYMNVRVARYTSAMGQPRCMQVLDLCLKLVYTVRLLGCFSAPQSEHTPGIVTTDYVHV